MSHMGNGWMCICGIRPSCVDDDVARPALVVGVPLRRQPTSVRVQPNLPHPAVRPFHHDVVEPRGGGCQGPPAEARTIAVPRAVARRSSQTLPAVALREYSSVSAIRESTARSPTVNKARSVPWMHAAYETP
jgi:hypothetical protein